MKNGWAEVQLGEVLTHRKEFIEIDDSKEYKRCRVQLHAKGVVLRDKVLGATIKTKRQQVCCEGEFLVAEIDAKVGGFGIVPPELNDAIVSSHYFLFSFDTFQLGRRFLDHYCRTPRFREQVDAQGSTNYAAIRPGHVLGYTIPLPPLQQQRIVAKIEQLAMRIEEAKGLNNTLANDKDLLCRSLLWNDHNLRHVAMSELVSLRESDTIVQPRARYHFAGIYCFGKGVFMGDHRSGEDFSYKRLTRLNAGNFTYPKLMAWEGALAVVPPECDGLHVSPEYPVFEINEELVLPETLDVYFRSPSVWPQLAAISTGTNVRRRRLHPKKFLQYQFPLPSMATQQRLRQIKRQIEETTPLRKAMSTEIDALLPSILDKAFKGEL